MDENNQPCFDIPEYLHRKGRPIDQIFTDEEILYRRFRFEGDKDEWIDQGLEKQASESIFKISSNDFDSYVRSKYCQSPNDVIFNDLPEENGAHHFDTGILELRAADIKKTGQEIYIQSEKRTFDFKPIHEPHECIYPHSELEIIKSGTENKKKTPAEKMAIRNFLMEFINILVPFQIKAVKDSNNTASNSIVN